MYLGNQNYVMVNRGHDLPHNYISTSNPTIDVNPPILNMTWLNTTTGEIFVCLDNTIGGNVWMGQDGNGVFDITVPFTIAVPNGDAESGIDGWIVDSGTLGTRPPNGFSAYDGANVFGIYANESRNRILLDMVPLNCKTTEYSLKLIWQQASYIGTDSSGMGLTLLSKDFANISGVMSTVIATAEKVWTERSVNLALQEGSYIVDINMSQVLNDGSMVDGYIDSIGLQLIETP